jgi:hypothetical protein
MRILLVRAPPEERFPGRFAQVVDHPYKCRSGTRHDTRTERHQMSAAKPDPIRQFGTQWVCCTVG